MSAPVITTSNADSSRHAHLARYGLWQLRDYSLTRGLPTFLIAAMFGALAVVPMVKAVTGRTDRMPAHFVQQQVAKFGSLQAFEQSMVHDMSGAFLRSFLGTVVFLGALFAMNGLVSNDRKQGFYRFLFSKPVSPVRYYAQAFVIHWAGFLAVVTTLALIYGAYVEPVLTPMLLVILALVYIMYAGIAFLMTTAVRWDWLGLAAVVIAAQVLWERFAASTSIFARLLYVLPPIHRTGDLYAALVARTAIPWHDAAWIAGYGAACTLAGLAVLRVKRLSIP